MGDSGQLTLENATIHWLCEEHADIAVAPALTPAESSAYAALRSEKRRHDWLLGRSVAKRLVQSALADQPGVSLSAGEIVILSHADGWPQVSLPTLGPDAPRLTLSISHSRDRAFCALVLGEWLLGCDLEIIEPRSAGFVADYFTAEEQALMSATAEARQPTLANAIWSGKEAALKAIRRGLAEDTRLVTCLPGIDEAGDGWRPLLLRWEQPERDLPPLVGRWQNGRGFVMTLAAGRAGA